MKTVDKLHILCYNYKMEKERTNEIISILSKAYPDAHCELDYTTTFELLVAVVLSAQCTDKRVNVVTKTLFACANTPSQFIILGQEAVEKLIYSCGFYRQKAKSIISLSEDILNKFGGEVPDDFDKLVSLRGVGRKTANVVMSVAFGGDNIAVDTHVFRTSRRLGFSIGNTPYEVEKDLNALLSDGQHSTMHHLLIFHGRYTCKSQRPLCEECPLTVHCKFLSSGKECV